MIRSFVWFDWIIDCPRARVKTELWWRHRECASVTRTLRLFFAPDEQSCTMYLVIGFCAHLLGVSHHVHWAFLSALRTIASLVETMVGLRPYLRARERLEDAGAWIRSGSGGSVPSLCADSLSDPLQREIRREVRSSSYWMTRNCLEGREDKMLAERWISAPSPEALIHRKDN